MLIGGYDDRSYTEILQPFFSLSISANIRLEETKAISIQDILRFHGIGETIRLLGQIGWNSQYWSHVYNAASMVYSPKVNADGSYASLTGFAVKVGDKYAPAGISGKALVRLPKDDKTYDYYDPSTGNLGGLKPDAIDRTDDGKGNLIIASVEPSSKEGAIGAVDVTLAANAHQGAGDGNYYYLTYNPYMATLDMKRFFANARNKAAIER